MASPVNQKPIKRSEPYKPGGAVVAVHMSEGGKFITSTVIVNNIAPVSAANWAYVTLIRLVALSNNAGNQ